MSLVKRYIKYWVIGFVVLNVILLIKFLFFMGDSSLKENKSIDMSTFNKFENGIMKYLETGNDKFIYDVSEYFNTEGLLGVAKDKLLDFRNELAEYVDSYIFIQNESESIDIVEDNKITGTNLSKRIDNFRDYLYSTKESHVFEGSVSEQIIIFDTHIGSYYWVFYWENGKIVSFDFKGDD